MKKLSTICAFVLFCSGLLHSQTIINQEYVQQWQAQPASPGLPVFNNCYLYLDQTTHLLIGINSDGSYCLAPNGSGGGIAPGTPYQVTRYDANGTNIQDSTGSDNPANGPTRWVQGLSVENNAGYRAFTNSPTATSLNQLVCLDPSVTTMAQVMTCAVSSTSVFGIADNGAGATGTVRVAMFGFHSCIFDNQTVVGDWVIPSTSVAGDCSDAGATKPTGSQVLGHATTLNDGAGTLGTVDLFTGDTIAPGGGGNPVSINPCVQVGCDAYYVMTNVIGGDPNTNDDGNGNKQSKSVGLTDSSQSGFWYEQAGPALPTLDGSNRFYFSVGPSFGTTWGLEAANNAPTTGHCAQFTTGDSAGWFFLADSGFACNGGYILQVNAVTLTSGDTVNFNTTTPVSSANGYNVTFQKSTASTTDSVSAEVVGDGNTAHFFRGDGTFASIPCTGAIVTTNETPSGTINSSNVTFTLAGTPNPGANLMLYRNGVLQLAGTDFTLSTATITFTVAPQTGDFLLATYQTGTGGCGGITGGTVTSVAQVSPNGILSQSGGPITISGTFTWAWAGTSGGIPYFASTSQVASSALLTQHALVLGGGAGATPYTLGSLGTTTTVLHGNASGDPSFSAIVTADLPSTVRTKTCLITTGDPGSASPVLANDNDAPAQCGNDIGADETITAVACWADAGAPTVTPILTGGGSTSILSGALTCGAAAWAAGSINGSPVVHSFSGAGATCSSTPCTLDANITTAGGTAKYIVIKITETF